MPGDGTPEQSTKRLGEEIARLRTKKNLTRTALASRATHSLDIDNPLTETIGENWLARLETGRMVKVTHEAIETLCKALNCTPSERAGIFMYANRNPLANEKGDISPEAELLGQIMAHLYQKKEVQEALREIQLKQKNPRLADEEISKIAQDIAGTIERSLTRKQKANEQKTTA